MRNVFSRWLLGLAVLLVVSLGISCAMPTSKLGDISISITQEVSNSRNLLPNLDMQPASYVISGTGPSGSTFTPVKITGTTTSIEKLVAGSWTITVDAYNADATPTKIGTGSATVLISNGRTTDVSVTVKPLSGNGTLTLNLTWPANILVNPQVVASLQPTTGSIQTITFNVGETSASFTSSTLPAGYYTLAISLNEGTTNVAGKSELVRIVAGQTTSGTYNFTDLNPAGGTASVTITPEASDPFVVSINGGQPSITVDASMNLTAVVSNYSGNLTYAWYVNGINQNVNTSSWTFGPGRHVGFYTIDVIAISSSGNQAGSATINTVIDPHIIAGGAIGNVGISFTQPGYWENGKWSPLTSQSTLYGVDIRALAFDNGDLYASGYVYDRNGILTPGYWKNGTWNSLPLPGGIPNACVQDITIAGSEVYAVGNSGATPFYRDQVAGYWKNGIWNELPSLSQTRASTANTITISDNDVYIGGGSLNDVPMWIPGYWKNGVWNGLPALNGGLVNAISTSGSKVLAVGSYYDNSGYSFAAFWKDNQLIPLPTLQGATGSYASSMFVYGSDVYIGGKMSFISGSSVYEMPGYWKNGIWVELPAIRSPSGASVDSISVYKGVVFAAGYRINDSSGYSEPGYWKNGIWVGLKIPENYNFGYVTSLLVY